MKLAHVAGSLTDLGLVGPHNGLQHWPTVKVHWFLSGIQAPVRFLELGEDQKHRKLKPPGLGGRFGRNTPLPV